MSDDNEHLYNIDAEKQVIGAILVSTGDALLRSMEVVGPGDFYSQKHRDIYSAFIEMMHENITIDLVTLMDRIKGVAGYCAELVSDTPTDANIIKHARIVKEKSTIRRVSIWARQINDNLKNGEMKSLELLASLESDIVSLSESVKEKSDPSIKNIVIELSSHWDKQRSNEKTHVKVDDFLLKTIPGLYPTHLWVIGGYTSTGKSTLLAQILRTALSDGARTLIFSTEDSRKDKAIKLLSNIVDVSQRRLITGDFDNNEIMQSGLGTLYEMPLKIYDDIYSVDEMRLKAKKHKMSGGLDIMAIDFIQNIQGKGSLYETMSKAIVDIQKLAKELEITIIVLSQVNNESMRGDSEVIGLKGAGELAAAADIVLWLKRSKKVGEEHYLDCEIRKNRPFGRTGVIPLLYSERYTKILSREVGAYANTDSRYGS